MKNNLLLLCLLFCFFSCEKEKKKETSVETIVNDSSKVLISETVEIIDTTYSESNSIEDYCIALKHIKEEYSKKIKDNKSNESNNELYEKYKLIRNTYLANINNSNGTILEKYIDYYDEKKQDYVLPDDVKKIEQQLKAVDVEFWYIGEGYTEFRNTPKHFLNIFKGKITSDYEDYIKQISNEDMELYSSDAGLVVSFDEVGNRVIYWENFINKYKNSNLLPKAKMHFNNYLHDFIFGLDNTPTFEDGQLYPELNEVYIEFMKKYPNSVTSKKIKELPNLVAKNLNHEEIFEKLKLEDRTWEDE